MKRILLLLSLLSALGLSAAAPVAAYADTTSGYTYNSGPIGPPTEP
ncbi:MAG: hypothetical protein K6T30_09575 [Alicyclobacillus sp.]|nr:hypothetical protein [Alicyclobacillus sp.]